MTPSTLSNPARRKAVWGPRRTIAVLALAALALPYDAAAKPRHQKNVIPHHQSSGKVSEGGKVSKGKSQTAKWNRLDVILQGRAKKLVGTVDVIVTLEPGQNLPAPYRRFVKGKKLDIINGYELDGLPVSSLTQLGKEVSVHRAHYNRGAQAQDLLSSTAAQTEAVVQQLRYTGAGVGVAFIDSGFTSYPQPDLTDGRVTFVDFVGRSNTRTDLNGHGTHVAGIVGGTGSLSSKEAGIAPGVSVVSLRVLDEQGRGRIGDMIAAMDWISKNYVQHNIRIVNMSVGAGVYESYWSDPLTLAAKALVDRGITVVAAAGNYGKNAAGEPQWGGITAPGVAPWVLTVCASSSQGTLDLSDDAVADFSSAGPTAVDFTAKPDICAPGVGVVSIAAPESRLYAEGGQKSPSWLVDPGNHPNYPYAPYLSLSGTSQAAPVAAGAVALMLQANPNLTPNLVKAILQYTASYKADTSPLRQGGGFLNAAGAVQLAKFYASSKPGAGLPVDPSWSQRIVWGNHMVSGGVLDPGGNAWMPGVEWGWAYTQGDDGDNIVWGTDCGGDDCDNIVWGTSDDGDNIVWGTSDDDDNIVWGTSDDEDNIVWGTSDDDDNIVWGTSDDGDNIVWGTGDDDDNIVWGTDCGGDDCDNIVWGTSDDADNIVWGTSDDGDNIVWGTGDDGDNIVWGTGDDGDNIVWGTGDDLDNIVWGTAAKENLVWSIYQLTGGK